MAAVDYFLKIDGISGESTDEAHKGEIEVESFSWGVSQTTTRLGSGAGAGRAVFQDLHFTTSVSKASPVLFQKCATGQHLKEAVLTCRKAGGEQREEFLKITLSDVLVSSYQAAGSAPPGPTEPPGDVILLSTNALAAGDLGSAPADSVALHYGEAKLSEGPQQHIDVRAVSGGLLVFDAKSGEVTTVPNDPENVPVIGAGDGSVRRLVQEFDVTDLLGLLTGPFPTGRLRLRVDEVRPQSDPGARTRGPEPHMHFDLLSYSPADLALTADDLTRHGRRIGTIDIDPRRDPASLDLDLGPRVWGEGTFGLRLQLRGAPIPATPPGVPIPYPNGAATASHLHDEDEQGDDDREDERERHGRTATASFTVSLAYDTA